MEIIWRFVAPECGSSAISMNVRGGKCSRSRCNILRILLMGRHVLFFGMEKDPSRDPSGTENTLTIISSGGMAKISYLFQVTKEHQREILTRRLIRDSKKK
jgi:hypothetical protein